MAEYSAPQRIIRPVLATLARIRERFKKLRPGVETELFSFVSDGLAPETFAVASLDGEEALSRPYRFELNLLADRADIDMDSVLRQPATLFLLDDKGEAAAHYRGEVAEFHVLRQVDDITLCRVVLVPRLWRLSQFRASEIYLGERTIPQVIETILKAAGFAPGIDYDMRLQGEYRPRSFVCQYQETYLDFISRWLEREGIYYWFEADGEREKVVFADNRFAHAKEAPVLVYRGGDQFDSHHLPDTLRGFTCRRMPLPARVIVRDYNYRKASLEVSGEAVVAKEGLGDVMLYGENVRNGAEASRVAAIRAEEIACRGWQGSGETAAAGLRCGHFMAVGGHFRPDFNQRYLVAGIRHRGQQATAAMHGKGGGAPYYRAEFTAIPGDVQFRPERLAPWPRIHGTMNATVDAEGTGKYAELNEFGQYKIQVPYDLTDKPAGKASTWVRMASPFVGDGFGMHMPLHKGTEVLLSFIDGDPDQPVIIGAVPNSEHQSTVTNANPTQSVLKTSGDNRIVMEDQAGKERILMHSPTADSFIRVGAPNDPWHCRWARPSMLLAEESGNGPVWGYEKNQNTGVFASLPGLTMATKGIFQVQAATMNTVVLGETSTHILGANINTFAGINVNTFLLSSFNFCAAAAVGINVGLAATFAENWVKVYSAEAKKAEAVIEDLGTKIQNATQKIEQSEIAIRNIDTKLDTVQTSITDIDNNLTTQGTALQDIGQDITKVGTRLDTVETSIENAQTSIKDTKTSIQDVKLSVEKSVTSVSERVTQIEECKTHVVQFDVKLEDGKVNVLSGNLTMLG